MGQEDTRRTIQSLVRRHPPSLDRRFESMSDRNPSDVKPEWRLGRGWSESELKRRLDELIHLPLSSTGSDDAALSNVDGEWRSYGSRSFIAREQPGPPVPGGAFERAKELLGRYEFSDPRIVTGHFDPTVPLNQRRILLEMKPVLLRYLGGVAVTAVRDEEHPGQSLFGFRIDTLSGHLEKGHEWFLVIKSHDDGAIRFRIRATWKPGDFPNVWSRVGFMLLVERYQRAWHRLAHLRMRELLGARGLPPLPRGARLVHEGTAIEMPRIGEVARHLPPLIPEEHETGGRSRSTSMKTAALLGTLSGIRSMVVPGLIAGRLEPLRRLDSPLARTAVLGLRLASLAERVGDKLPWLPARTEAIPLTGRMVGGASMAALVVNDAPVKAAGVGALFAAGAAFAATGLRGLATNRLGIPNVAAGLIEDGIVSWLGRRLVT